MQGDDTDAASQTKVDFIATLAKVCPCTIMMLCVILAVVEYGSFDVQMAQNVVAGFEGTAAVAKVCSA